MSREYVLTLDRTHEGEPLYAAIARALSNDIARGRLRPGARLPGSRTLATMLGVNRNTVHAALQELVHQGWVEAQPARGMFVRQPEGGPAKPFSRAVPLRTRVPTSMGFELEQSAVQRVGAAIPERPLNLLGGVPDPRLLPHELIARAYRRALKRRGGLLLDYGDARGELSLRSALADMLTRLRGLAAEADDLIITRGSQQAIWLAARCLLGPGARIGVESWGYPPAWEAFRSTGAELVPLTVDGDGLSIEALERALESGPLRALYLTPHHQYPTMVGLSAQRRLRLLELARRHRFAILEDDYAHEFHYDGRPRLPLASADVHGVVVYIGTLSKILAPGLRIGYAVAPRPLLERMAAERTIIDRQGDAAMEAAIAELLEDGEIERHARRVRRVYAERRELLAHELRAKLGAQLSFELPAGGMAFWLRVNGVAPSPWAARALARGVLFRAGRVYSLLDEGDVPFVRMGFTALDPRELKRAVSLAATALTR